MKHSARTLVFNYHCEQSSERQEHCSSEAKELSTTIINGISSPQRIRKRIESETEKNLEPVTGIQRQCNGVSPHTMVSFLADSMKHLTPVSLSNHMLCTTTTAAAPTIDYRINRESCVVVLTINDSKSPFVTTRSEPYSKAVGE
jgi:hypothetical protein